MIYLFNNQEELIKILRKDAIVELLHITELTDENYVSDRLEASVKALPDDLISEIEYLAIPSEEDYKFHLFFLAKSETRNDLTYLTGVQSAIEELRKSFPPDKQTRPREVEARFYLDRALSNTNWETGYVADKRLSIHTYYDTTFDVLKKVCLATRMEMEFFAEINDNRIGNRYIDFRNQIGGNHGRRVVYGMNGLEVIQEVESMELYTALIGRGKGEEVSSAEDNTSGQAGYGRKITFADVVWSKANGDPVDKPAGQEYVELPDATKQYGIKSIKGGNRPKIGMIEFQDEEDPEILLKMTYETLKDYARPRMTFKTSVVYLRGELGDTVRVVRPDRNLDYSTRIFKITYDRLTNRAIEIILGDQMNLSEGRKRAQLESSITNAIDKHMGGTMDQILNVLPSANGMIRNFYMSDEPQNPRVGDIWYKPDPTDERHTILYMWNGEAWEEIVRSKDWNVVEEKLKEMDELVKEHDALINKRQEELDKELEEFRKSMDFEIEKIVIKEIDTSFKDLRSQVDAISETSRINAEMIGNDGITRYNKNILKGEFKRTITLEDKMTTIVANDGGFKKGETYTISFESICHLIEQYMLIFKLSAPYELRPVDITVTNDRKGIDPTTQTTDQETTEVETYQGAQTIQLVSDWYKTIELAKEITEPTTIELDLEYKDYVENDLTSEITLQWNDNHELLIKGGV
ncbi:phage tail spike protein [Dolosicoccus paucivorans]